MAVFLTDAEAAIATIGSNRVRENLYNRLQVVGFELAALVHPRAVVSRRGIIGPGSAVMAGAIVGTEARLG